MKNIFLIAAFFICSLSVNTDWFELFQADYFVSETGDDSNSGLYPWSPWQTLTKVNSIQASLPDSSRIAFHGDGEWSGTLTIGKSKLIFKKYGQGEDPIISGSETVTGWTLYAGNIYKATVDKANIAQLFEDGQKQKLARYPNSGYALITSITNDSVFTSTQIDGALDKDSATIIMRCDAYTFQNGYVTTYSGQQLSLANALYNGSGTKTRTVNSNGFWLTNKRQFIDTPGEWYYDNGANILYYWSADGTSPADNEVTISTFDNNINIGTFDYITIKNLNLKQAANQSILAGTGSTNITIDNCTISEADVIAVSMASTANSSWTLRNNTISGSGSGVILMGANCVFTNNNISDIGKLENVGKNVTVLSGFGNGTKWGAGLFTRSNGHNIQHNLFINIAYSGINFQGLNTAIKYNYFNGINQVADDGAAIYATSETTNKDLYTVGSVIQHNIIINSIGNNSGTDKNYTAASGIYLDFEPKGILIYDNLIWNTSYGIFVTGGGGNYIRRNTIGDSGYGILFDKDNSDSNGLIYFRSNTVYATGREKFNSGSTLTQRLFYQENTPPPKEWYQNDSNLYIVPYVETGAFRAYNDFQQWKDTTGTDSHSTYNGTDLAVGKNESVIYNNSNVAKLFLLNGATNLVNAVTGANITTNFTLQPWTWVIVQGNNTDYIKDYIFTPPVYDFTDGLIFAYDFEESGPPLTDDSGMGHTTNTLTNLTYAQPGNPGTAISLNGSSRIGVDDALDLSIHLDSCTFEFWIKVDNVTGTKRIFHKSNEYRVEQVGDDIAFYIYQAGGNEDTSIKISAVTNLVVGVWYNIILTYNGNNNVSGMKCYRNGYLTFSGPTGTTISGTNEWSNSMFIGGLTGAFFVGDYSEVRLWNRMFSEDECLKIQKSRAGFLTSEF